MANNVVDVSVENDTLQLDNTGNLAPIVAKVEGDTCTVYALASDGKPIAFAVVRDKETGTETPVHVYTCAEAVVCSKGIPMEQHLVALYSHANDTAAHLTAEEKAGFETKEGAQSKADKAKSEAYTAASLLVQAAKIAASEDAAAKATAAQQAACAHADKIGGNLETHKTDKTNPHGVTASQVGLGNVPNKATNDLVPTYTVAEILAPLTSGEKLAAAFGKVAKAIEDYISHSKDTSNPHKVTASQVGAVPKSGGTMTGQLAMTGTLKMDGGHIMLKRGVNFGTEDEIPADLPDGALFLKVVE